MASNMKRGDSRSLLLAWARESPREAPDRKALSSALMCWNAGNVPLFHYELVKVG